MQIWAIKPRWWGFSRLPLFPSYFVRNNHFSGFALWISLGLLQGVDFCNALRVEKTNKFGTGHFLHIDLIFSFFKAVSERQFSEGNKFLNKNITGCSSQLWQCIFIEILKLCYNFMKYLYLFQGPGVCLCVHVYFDCTLPKHLWSCLELSFKQARCNFQSLLVWYSFGVKKSYRFLCILESRL